MASLIFWDLPDLIIYGTSHWFIEVYCQWRTSCSDHIIVMDTSCHQVVIPLVILHFFHCFHFQPIPKNSHGRCCCRSQRCCVSRWTSGASFADVCKPYGAKEMCGVSTSVTVLIGKSTAGSPGYNMLEPSVIGVSCTFSHWTFLVLCYCAVFAWHRVSWSKMLHKKQYIYLWLLMVGWLLWGFFIYHESLGKYQWLCEASSPTPPSWPSLWTAHEPTSDWNVTCATPWWFMIWMTRAKADCLSPDTFHISASMHRDSDWWQYS